jgi:hypothetical protein
MASNPLSIITTSATALSNLILVSPQKTQGYQPMNPANSAGGSQNPPSLLFHYEGEQTVSIESDITDHYIEDNTAIQDQVALRPVIVTTHGFIGELNDVPPVASAAVQLALQKLSVISSYTPQLTLAALIAYNEALQLYQVGASAVNSSISAWSSLNNQGGENVIGSNGIGTAVNLSSGKVTNNQNKQQVAFQQFYAYWAARWLFTVQTPWAVFQNMAIQRLRAIQSADTNVITDFEVTFKMIRTAVSAKNQSDSIAQGRVSSQSASAVNQGTQTLAQESPVTFPGLGSF